MSWDTVSEDDWGRDSIDDLSFSLGSKGAKKIGRWKISFLRDFKTSGIGSDRVEKVSKETDFFVHTVHRNSDLSIPRNVSLKNYEYMLRLKLSRVSNAGVISFEESNEIAGEDDGKADIY